MSNAIQQIQLYLIIVLSMLSFFQGYARAALEQQPETAPATGSVCSIEDWTGAAIEPQMAMRAMHRAVRYGDGPNMKKTPAPGHVAKRTGLFGDAMAGVSVCEISENTSVIKIVGPGQMSDNACETHNH